MGELMVFEAVYFNAVLTSKDLAIMLSNKMIFISILNINNYPAIG